MNHQLRSSGGRGQYQLSRVTVGAKFLVGSSAAFLPLGLRHPSLPSIVNEYYFRDAFNVNCKMSVLMHITAMFIGFCYMWLIT